MATAILGDWSSSYIGISPEDGGGKVAFIPYMEVARVALICWP